MFNLLHRCIEATISCSKPAVDGYEVQNLLVDPSNEYFVPRNGFIAESFIKPPVDIVIKFPFNVEIDKIILDSKVGGQCSTSFEIYGYSNSKHDQNAISCDTKTVKFDPTVYTFMGKGFSDKHIFCFRNKRFMSKPIYSKITEVPSIYSHLEQTKIAEFELNHKYPCPVKNLSYLNIRIQRAASGSACSLKSLEIWGQPSNFTSKAVIEQIITKYCENEKKTMFNTGLSPFDNNCIDISEKKDMDLSTEAPFLNDTAPEEYIDPITQEILVIPMLLPSGHTVDLSTLDRHNKEEEKWGRRPSDPFTGKAFSGASAPVPNTSLKVRIDEFLIHNPQIIAPSQTIGTKNGYFKTGHGMSNISKLVINPWDKKVNKASISNSITSPISCKRKLPITLTSETNNLECSVPDFKCRRLKKPSIQLNKLEIKHNVDFVPKTVNIPGKCHLLKTTGNDRPENHASRLSSSLNVALSSTLSILPSFSKGVDKVSNEQSESFGKNCCVFCQKRSSTALYKIKCSHLICRNCLINCDGNTVCCPQDSIVSLQNEVVKVYVN